MILDFESLWIALAPVRSRFLSSWLPSWVEDCSDGVLLTKLLKKLARATLVVIDDFGVAAVTGRQYRDLLEILDDRHGQGSTLITSQFPVDQWHGVINDATVADAILDRVVHNAYRLDLKGESIRKTRASLNANTKPPAD